MLTKLIPKTCMTEFLILLLTKPKGPSGTQHNRQMKGENENQQIK